MPGGTTIENIGRYRVNRVLGTGSMGIVFHATDPYIERDVAIKLSRHQETGSDTSPDKYNRKFFNEARTAGRLHHPNICAVYDADVYQDTCYIVMEYVDGPTIEAMCRKDTLPPLSIAARIVLDACKALDYSHGLGVIHRDIKPSNILLAENQVVKITDFGIAMITEETVKLSLVGTPHYMSPEQIEDEITDGRGDIFALGCILYELLVGEKLFPGDTPAQVIHKIIKKEPAPLDRVGVDVPAELKRILAKSLEKKPENRYQTCADFAYDLKLVLRYMDDIHKETKHEHVLEYITNLPFFEHFSRSQVQTLLSVSEIWKYPKEKVIFSEGEVDDTLFIILSGEVNVEKNKQLIGEIGRGECFGEMAFLSGQPRQATVSAKTECTLLKIDAMLMNRLGEDVQLLIMRSFAMTLVNRLASANLKLTSWPDAPAEKSGPRIAPSGSNAPGKSIGRKTGDPPYPSPSPVHPS